MCAHCAVEVNTDNISRSINSKDNRRKTIYGFSNGDAPSRWHFCEPGSVSSMFHRLLHTCVCLPARCKVHRRCPHRCDHPLSGKSNAGTICYDRHSLQYHCSSSFQWPSTLSSSILIKCTILKSQLFLLLCCLVPFLFFFSSCILSVAAHPSEYTKAFFNRVALTCNLI